MNKKNGMLITLCVFCGVLVFMSLLFYINLKDEKTIEVEAVVKMLGDDYIVAQDDNNKEYYLEIEKEYYVGDRVDFVLKNIKNDGKYFKGKLVKIETISQKVNFAIMDDQDKNSGDGNKTDNLNVSETVFSEDDVVSFFMSLDKDLDNYEQNNSSFDKIKSSFVLVVDFLFYGGQIKGRTFEELSSDAKIKILQVALSIDKKVEKHFPGYKEAISTNSKKLYSNIKGRVLELYLDITLSLCDNNEDACETAKKGLKDMKTSFSITWDFIKEIGVSGIGKLDRWYRIWKET